MACRRNRAILLISDGEAGDAEAALSAAERAASAGIRVYGLLVGTEAGAPIPLDAGGFKKTRSGEVVVTRARADVLQQVAKATDGALVSSMTQFVQRNRGIEGKRPRLDPAQHGHMADRAERQRNVAGKAADIGALGNMGGEGDGLNPLPRSKLR